MFLFFFIHYLQQPKLERSLPGTVLYFYCFISQISRIVSTEQLSLLLLCRIWYICYYLFWYLGYGFAVVIPKAVNEALNVLIDNPP